MKGYGRRPRSAEELGLDPRRAYARVRAAGSQMHAEALDSFPRRDDIMPPLIPHLLGHLAPVGPAPSAPTRAARPLLWPAAGESRGRAAGAGEDGLFLPSLRKYNAINKTSKIGWRLLLLAEEEKYKFRLPIWFALPKVAYSLSTEGKGHHQKAKEPVGGKGQYALTKLYG